MLGNYDHIDDDKYEMSFSILMGIHLFIANIFLLNYLVAILSTVYNLMMNVGEFEFKVSMYKFIEKYSMPMAEKHGYKELVVHPPPLNIISIGLMPLIVSRKHLKKVTDYFSKVMFWIENIPILFAFFAYECIIAPFVYIKQYYVLFMNVTSVNFPCLLGTWIGGGRLYHNLLWNML